MMGWLDISYMQLYYCVIHLVLRQTLGGTDAHRNIAGAHVPAPVLLPPWPRETTPPPTHTHPIPFVLPHCHFYSFLLLQVLGFMTFTTKISLATILPPSSGGTGCLGQINSIVSFCPKRKQSSRKSWCNEKEGTEAWECWNSYYACFIVNWLYYVSSCFRSHHPYKAVIIIITIIIIMFINLLLTLSVIF